MRKGKLIAFEGIDGSGKSTQAVLLHKHLSDKGYKVYQTCEPTYNEIGKLIRDCFTGQKSLDHRTIAGLFVADRLDHILNESYGMLYQIEHGNTVICDRYYLSSLAYQGTHMSMDWVMKANSLAMELLKPDLHIFIDIDPEIAIERISKNRPNTELYETLDNLIQVRNKYMQAINLLNNSENIVVLIGDQTEEEIHQQVLNILEKNEII
ncbi:MAG: dTMP kinase [Saprospiraceae bacterium]|nr:dTMP kinase [Saprospiraceae bacterium]MBK7809693.1 dTMP kinase [Saprospiraceae bacterium]MBK9632197.1 dTMP kinase [Saprospiraceae bacterium]